jgi:hypothetical protein
MTSKQRTISLLSLPTELLHRICDFLEAETIVLSFRHVCAQLFATAETYNRYKCRFSSMSKMNICRTIPAENVILLDFRNKKNTIELFLSAFDIHQFIRLRSLSIDHINVTDLNTILHHTATNCRLKSLSIYSNVSQISDDTWQLLSLTTAQPNLHHLRLNFDYIDQDKFFWPVRCATTNLSIATCTFKQISSILRNSPQLYTLTINNCQIIEMDKSFLLNSYQQLNSLTINDVQMTMDKLEFFLSFLPSLIHLDLTSSGKPYEFIQRLSR